ncbi:MAG: NifU family protein [Firmicutes bacterium]|nr:NifU family protein [Alicyclobacillaceae bacterium]MCL6496232.1 NifU family protein [Bacillota bacterium]
MAASNVALEEALQEIRAGLAADGFDVEVEDWQEGGRLALKVTAGAEACLDCLLPEPVLAAMVEDILGRHGVSVREVALSLPVEE